MPGVHSRDGPRKHLVESGVVRRGSVGSPQRVGSRVGSCCGQLECSPAGDPLRDGVRHPITTPQGRGSWAVSPPTVTSACSAPMARKCPHAKMQVATGVDRRCLQAVTFGEHQRDGGASKELTWSSLSLTLYISTLK